MKLLYRIISFLLVAGICVPLWVVTSLLKFIFYLIYAHCYGKFTSIPVPPETTESPFVYRVKWIWWMGLLDLMDNLRDITKLKF